MKKHTITVNELKLSLIAEEIIMVNKFKTIFEQIVYSTSLIKEAEDVELSDDEKKAMDKLIGAFVDQLKKGSSEVKADAQDEKEVDKLKKEFPAIAKIEDEVKEGNLNEFVISANLIAGILAALPKLIQLFGYLVQGIGSLISIVSKKGEEKLKAFAKKIIHAGHELHHKYILGIQKGMQMLIPDFDTIPNDAQLKIAELAYLVVVMMLGMDAGLNATNALQHADWVHGSVEGLLAAIKGGEVGAWLGSQIAAAIA